MSGNSFGKLFKITTFGESHGSAIGCIIDGCPSMLDLSTKDIQVELDRRRPGQSDITTGRAESDVVEILSGVFEGKTTGTPICLIVKNEDQRSHDYSSISNLIRPGHADFTYQMKYGIRDYRGGGRSSARETIARVAAGAIAKKYLKKVCNLEILGFTSSIGSISADYDISYINSQNIENNIARCPDEAAAEKMISAVRAAKENGDSLGGIVSCVIKNCPVGVGEPVFDKLHARLAYAMMGINAVKGFEVGDGFHASSAFGSENNDEFYFDHKANKVGTKTNHSGGVLGGISNGEDLFFKVAFKPVATIKKPQTTVDILSGKDVEIAVKEGRHDPCVVPRAVPIVEAMAALVLIDLFLINKGLYGK